MTQPAAGSWQLLVSPFNLENGARYAATILLTGLESLASTAQIAQKFVGAGFRDVTVQSDKKRVEGTWARPDAQGVVLPSQVRQVWKWSAEEITAR